MYELSNRMKKVTPSATLAISAKAKQMKHDGIDVIPLSAGEPDWDPPYEMQESAITAIKDGNTSYTAASGLAQLKELVAEKLVNENKLEVTKDNIIITHGAKFSLYSALQALVNPDEEVLIIAPYWVSYVQQVNLAGGRPKIIKTTEEEGFKLDPDDLEQHISSRVKGIILNYPSNPTGITYSEEELRQIGEICSKHDLFIISDEIYEYFNYDQDHVSIASLNKKWSDNVITINGFSKAFAIPGWRVGYTAAHPDLIKAMGSIQSHAASNPNTIAQLACLTALKENKDFPAKMVKEYLERRDFIVEALNNLHGFRCHKPVGAFYVFPNVQYYLGNEVGGTVPNDTLEFVNTVLEKAHISMVPGSAFGMEGYVRMSYTQPIERLKEAVSRLDEILEK